MTHLYLMAALGVKELKSCELDVKPQWAVSTKVLKPFDKAQFTESKRAIFLVSISSTSLTFRSPGTLQDI